MIKLMMMVTMMMIVMLIMMMMITMIMSDDDGDDDDRHKDRQTECKMLHPCYDMQVNRQGETETKL